MDLRAYMFGGFTRQTVYKSLDAGSLRDKAISQNIANASTPGFKRKEVTFEDELRKVMKVKLKGERTHNEHMEISQEAALRKIYPKVLESQDPTLPGEINNVDIDIENAKMAENQILFSYALKFAGFDKYNAAITGSPK
ncbi:MAG: flagellar basal body rod protein FlgB [Fibrobacteria bacterium]|nr:flagellar basal body rod protein FlgB [Fibrobacteria bacterium]